MKDLVEKCTEKMKIPPVLIKKFVDDIIAYSPTRKRKKRKILIIF